MPAQTPDPDSSLEQAMSRLEDLVAEIEQEGAPLQQMVANYEEGMKLLRHCGRILNDAQRRVDLVTRDVDGQAALEAFDPTAEPKPAQPAPKKKAAAAAAAADDEEIRLF